MFALLMCALHTPSNALLLKRILHARLNFDITTVASIPLDSYNNYLKRYLSCSHGVKFCTAAAADSYYKIDSADNFMHGCVLHINYSVTSNLMVILLCVRVAYSLY